MTAHIIDCRQFFEAKRRQVHSLRVRTMFEQQAGDCIRTGRDATMPKPFLNDESDGGDVA